MRQRTRPMLVVMAVLVAGLGVSRASVNAQVDATFGGAISELTKVKGAVTRSFAATGFRPVGPILMQFIVVEFDSEDDAKSGAEQLAPDVLAFLGGESRGYKQASVRPLGDDVLAYAGTIDVVSSTAGEPGTFVGAILFVRDAAFLHVAFGAGFAGDPLADLTNTVESVLDRHRTGGTPVASMAPHRGELWDALPMLVDIPEGFTVDEEKNLGSSTVASPIARDGNPFGGPARSSPGSAATASRPPSNRSPRIGSPTPSNHRRQRPSAYSVSSPGMQRAGPRAPAGRVMTKSSECIRMPWSCIVPPDRRPRQGAKIENRF